MRLLIKTRTLHKWLMRGIGIQVLIWALTGLYMVSMDIHFIHGETLSDDKHNQFSIQDASYPIAALLDAFPTATQVTLYKRQDKLVYRFKRTNDTQWTIVDATNGQQLSPLTSLEARQIATSSVTDFTNIAAVKLIDLPEATPAELSPRWLPVWQVTFDDLAGTTFYIQQATGQIVTRRHNVWRAFDWMWRLHIMDYDDGENVANPLLLVLAVLAIVAIISGILLLACRFLSVSPPGSNTLNALNKGGHND